MTAEISSGEIVIVRRRPAWDADHHKGGVWKIAFADFMTAMMAFFLVMWLINVTDENVRQGVAQYFNPVKLAATSPTRKGLNDAGESGDAIGEESDRPPAQGGSENKPAGPARHSTGGEYRQFYSEAALFSDPYAVLDTLARSITLPEAEGPAPEKAGFGTREGEGAQGGDAYRDPFDPLYWQFLPNRGAGAAERPIELAMEPARTEAAEGMPEPRPEASPESRSAEGVGKPAPPSPLVASVAPSPSAKPDPNAADAVASGVSAPQAPSAAAPASPEASDLAKTAAALQADLQGLAETPLGAAASRITVERTGAGLLISLTDDQDFGMFAVGSAEPRPELVRLMERIGSTLSARPGRIVIRGHTDARPFRSKTYDNWRLSSARAHMALYMLARGGVDAGRVERIEGYADRDLKRPSDPYSAVNRRIEIFLLEPGA
ncbi:MotB family protein [Polymorphum gilvum]|uniref:Flagellar motor protein MotB n=1 Tax=Polymorphum gilvum (strain LMG 25793 / CGMCC 1.9160 / SL003B-26A1) TaxID=991905 RepID=F2J4P7_POLGS|nr:MotB family protein [Polymorphum gilvum]ADZ72299.1 Flagellar motor protein MotB [Polymorphum gilvum SL003B-26A1]